MSLLPIIYTSILIFGSLLVFVLLLSYVSYRIKQNNRLAGVGPNGKSSAVLTARGNYPKLRMSERLQENISQSQARNHQIVYPRTKSVYYREEREVGNKKIDVIIKTPPAPKLQTMNYQQQKPRLTRINQLNTVDAGFNRNWSDESGYNQIVNNINPDRIKENDIFKYYEDF